MPASQDDPAAPYLDAIRHGGGFLVQVRIAHVMHVCCSSATDTLCTA